MSWCLDVLILPWLSEAGLPCPKHTEKGTYNGSFPLSYIINMYHHIFLKLTVSNKTLHKNRIHSSIWIEAHHHNVVMMLWESYVVCTSHLRVNPRLVLALIINQQPTYCIHGNAGYNVNLVLEYPTNGARVSPGINYNNLVHLYVKHEIHLSIRMTRGTRHVQHVVSKFRLRQVTLMVGQLCSGREIFFKRTNVACSLEQPGQTGAGLGWIEGNISHVIGVQQAAESVIISWLQFKAIVDYHFKLYKSFVILISAVLIGRAVWSSLWYLSQTVKIVRFHSAVACNSDLTFLHTRPGPGLGHLHHLSAVLRDKTQLK